MSTRVFSMIMAFAYRRARKAEGRLWWIVLAIAALARALDRRSARVVTNAYDVRPGESLDVSVESRVTL